MTARRYADALTYDAPVPYGEPQPEPEPEPDREPAAEAPPAPPQPDPDVFVAEMRKHLARPGAVTRAQIAAAFAAAHIPLRED